MNLLQKPHERRLLAICHPAGMKDFNGQIAFIEIVGRNLSSERSQMLWILCVILLILWLLGLVSGYTMGGVIHILLVIAIVVVLVRVIQGRRPL